MVENHATSKQSPLVDGGDISRHAGESHYTQRLLSVFYPRDIHSRAAVFRQIVDGVILRITPILLFHIFLSVASGKGFI